MRALLLFVALAATALSGCADDSADDPMDETPDEPMPSSDAMMEPLTFSGSVTVGADPANFATGAPCSTPASTCYYHDFTIPANQSVDLVATLAWGIPANDLDLYLYQGSTQLSQDGINTLPPAAGVPEASQVMHHAALGPGDYSFWVVIWNGVADDYTLDVVFE